MERLGPKGAELRGTEARASPNFQGGTFFKQ